MGLASEFWGLSVMDKAKPGSFLCSSSALVNLENRVHANRLRLKRGVRTADPMASVSVEQRVVKIVPEKAVKFKVRAVVTVRNKEAGGFKEALIKRLDAFTADDQLGRNVVLELISTEIDPKTKGPMKSEPAVLKDWAVKTGMKTETVNYSAEFEVDTNFGCPGAITVVNKHQQEFFLENITLEGFSRGPVYFPCSSWVQSKKNYPRKRIFFSNKPYLPHETPEGVKALREEELRDLRGDGNGVRQLHDRIFDFDVYNDLGNPDKGVDFVRPTLGGEAIPYPRRCRTGRPPCVTDPSCESRLEKPAQMYVPRDEQFDDPKRDAFLSARLRGTMHNLLPGLQAKLSEKNMDFQGFQDLDSIYSETLFNKLGIKEDVVEKLPLPKIVQRFKDADVFKFNIPTILGKDKLAWLRDGEFARQMLAGISPVHIERLRVFPPVSKLDPAAYGPLKSALKEEHILAYLNGMSVQEALDSNKLYIVDYHDVYFPFVDRINALDGRAIYATRTIFFLTDNETLKPIAIELCLPANGHVSRSKRVVTPDGNATSFWMWQIAKAHVSSNDASVHQLIHHWLRTHSSMEPFILSAHRQLSAMHPIYKLLDPHMRYTLEINALARQTLINNEGVLESCFTHGRYAMQISAAAYKSFWQFNLENLPADLIRRGMAVADPMQPHGLKLLIEDYPYAADGLLIWEAIQKWVTTYVNHYYPDFDGVCNDRELQAWYSEAVNVGHADLRNAEWWPTLESPADLASILTTIIWLCSAQHAALNFGQYPYGGYLPNRPTLMRRLIPDENDPEYAVFVSDPQKYFFKALPSKPDATKLIAVVDTLSTHSPDEEYLGERPHPSTWTSDAAMVEAFFEFSADIGQIEEEIDSRNRNPSLNNRCGAGVIPYELLAPSSGPGVTCRGIPNSVTI
ncbi:linoleate 13S-lipoxygenase 3-1, chloroplastic-like isoform X2 [Ipomoea triloba]|uniref:linoleate 13S-lipoxygenase 3-1, chloroplastic-like isoform X2 n=1 Tax=Ipomoea triloba TaxID=35885 RepID=UPI00125D1466|nr:linoleate 13S-lipoxygenase 3-1, chloroplastic-like isoform X2 [Ipomoea triloba]